MIVSGGTRPPVPITVGAGSGLPVESTETDGEASSVVVRLPVVAPPGRNSCTRAADADRVADASASAPTR